MYITAPCFFLLSICPCCCGITSHPCQAGELSLDLHSMVPKMIQDEASRSHTTAHEQFTRRCLSRSVLRLHRSRPRLALCLFGFGKTSLQVRCRPEIEIPTPTPLYEKKKVNRLVPQRRTTSPRPYLTAPHDPTYYHQGKIPVHASIQARRTKTNIP